MGLRNFERLSRDPSSGPRCATRCTFLAGYVPLVLAAGLAVAVALNGRVLGRGVFRAVYFLPVVTSWVAVALVWRWLLNPHFGLVNAWLAQVGVAGPRRGCSTPNWAMASVILTSVWKDTGFVMVILLAGLQGIPRVYYEAADDRRRRPRPAAPLRHRAALAPAMFFALTISLINSFQVFDQVYVMTGGGPAGATTVLVERIVKQAFSFSRMGYASAMSWVLFVLIFAITFAFSRPAAAGGRDSRPRAPGRLVDARSRSAWCSAPSSCSFPSPGCSRPASSPARRCWCCRRAVPQEPTVEAYRSVVARSRWCGCSSTPAVAGARHHRRAAGRGVPVRLRLRALQLPRPRRALRGLPRHAHGAVRGDDHAALHHRAAPSAGSTPTSGWWCPPCSRRSAPSSCASSSTVPRELEEAATLDGAGALATFVRVILPISGPAFATLGVFAFMASWNNFLWPLLVVSDREFMTLPLALATLQGLYPGQTQWNLVMAGTVVSVIPMIVVFLLAQRWVIEGVTTSGLKG